MTWTRRKTIATLAAAPWIVRAADGKARVAVMASSDEAGFRTRADALRRALPGVALDFHYADGRMDRLAEVAREVVASSPAVIVSSSALTTRPLRQATATVPIVMANADEPVADRFVASAEKPGGNVTGLFSGRRDDLVEATRILSAVVPGMTPLGGLSNQFNVNYRPSRSRLNFGAQQAKRPVEFLDASTAAEIDRVFDGLAAQHIAGVVVMADPLYLDERERLVKAAARAKIPAIYADRAFVRAGGLMAYGGDSDADMARVAVFVKKILAGARPADLALEKAGTPHLYVNDATAKALGLRIPASVRKTARGA